MSADLTSWWGKTTRHGDCHPLIWHSLDVAAVGTTLLRKHVALHDYLCESLGLTSTSLKDWIFFFTAIHDIGKFSYRFQCLREDVAVKRLSAELPENAQKSNVRHDQLGYQLWQREIAQKVLTEHLVGSEEWKPRKRASYLEPWSMVGFGHHGQPVKQLETRFITSDYFTDHDTTAAHAFIDELLSLMQVQALSLPGKPIKAATESIKQNSWLISGLITLSDWLGSNATYFRYMDETTTFSKYWDFANVQAERAVESSGVLPSEVTTFRGFSGLFPKFSNYELSPLQALAESMTLSDEPQLIVCEDVTGAGKTEAALILAQRLMQQSRVSGLYFALPTMGTANGMFGRTQSIYRNFFADNQKVSLVLSHSSRDLDKRFKELVKQLTTDSPEVDDLESGVDTSVSSCTAWLADSKKKSLLAQVGVGTIDQVFQSILMNKHQSLRLLGLFGKVLVVDEVHANDAYMHRLLRVLLSAHAAAGGNAILLSATLPKKMRNELFAAYGVTAGDTEVDSYPLLSHGATGRSLQAVHVDTPKRVCRTVAVEYKQKFEQVLKKIVDASSAGLCIVWIRNSVADARAAKRHLSDLLPDITIDLFHARYTIGDRLEIENRVLKNFGPESAQLERSGQILIATQVVEQSLDIDFDLMISDIAPIDLLIQRAGRLCRHVRDVNGNRINGDKDGRGPPTLVVYGPDPSAVTSKDWIKSVLPATSYVYPDHAGLWLTANELVKRGGWRMPEDARALIETVYGDDDSTVPELLEYSRMESIGEAQSNSSIGKANTINMKAGYALKDERTWWTEISTPTRLGEKSNLVYLAREKGGEIAPWQEAEGEDSWAMSRMQILGRRLFEGAQGDAIDELRRKLPGRGKWCEVLVFSKNADEVWRASAKNEKGELVLFSYSRDEGLTYDLEMTDPE